MEARCYRGGDGRTKMKPLHYEKRDYTAYTILLIYFAVMIGAAWLGEVIMGIILGLMMVAA